MATAQEQLVTFQEARDQKIVEIESVKQQLQEIQAEGLRDQQKQARVRDLSDEISRLDIQISITQQVITEIGTAEVSEREQERVISAREGQTFAAIRERVGGVVRREPEIQEPTPTERELRQSLPANLRNLPVEQVRRIQQEARQRTEPVGFGQTITRERLEEIRRQSLPAEVVGGAVEFEFKQIKEIEATPPRATFTSQGINIIQDPLATPQQIREQQAKNLGTVLFLGGIATPGKIVSAVTPIVQRVRFVGTIQRTGDVSKIGIVTGTRISRVNIFGITRTKDIFGTARLIIKEEGISFGRGATFELQKITKLPSITPTIELKKIEPFVSAGVGQRIGKAFQVKDLQAIKVKREIGIADLIRTQTLTAGGLERDVTLFVSRKGLTPDVLEFIGGRPALRVKRLTGDLSLIVRQPKIKGVLVRLETPEIEGGISSLLRIGKKRKKRTPLELTFQEQQALAGAVTPKITSLTPPKVPKTILVKDISPRQELKVETITPQISQLTTQQLITKQKQLPTIRQAPRISERQRERQRQVSIQKIRLAQPLKEKQKPIQIPKQAIRQITRQRQKTPLIPRQITPPIPRPRILKQPLRPRGFPFPLFKTPRQPALKQRRGVGIQIRRDGIFRLVGGGLPLGQAVRIGQERVGRRGAFKIIGGVDVRTPFGFRRKPTREGIIFVKQPRRKRGILI